MNIFGNSSVQEDRYIAHLAGQKNGDKIIGFWDQYNASGAQKHPICNRITSNIIGLVKGTFLTTVGVLAYPLYHSKESIFGSSWNVCTTCGINHKSITDVIINFQRLLDPKNAQTHAEQIFTSYGLGIQAASACASNEEEMLKCRAVNYAGSLIDTVSNHYILIGAITLCLVTGFASSKMNSYVAKECRAEDELKKNLADRFGKIATRLTAREAEPAIHAIAQQILQRRLEINQDVANLELPNLAWKDVELITQPVFEAAEKIQKKQS